MKHKLPDLPYDISALEPHISKETLEYHHGKHHNAYVTNLNKMIEGTEFEDMTLEDIIKNASAGIYNNAAQIWNHTFYWNCLTGGEQGDLSGDLADAINKKFGSVDDMKKEFTASAMGNFGSGWTWLVKTSSGEVDIVNTSNAGCVIADGQHPLLVCDVWEHAYYVDTRNDRGAYLKNYWELVNWSQVVKNYEA